jgi:hypothetical protein
MEKSKIEKALDKVREKLSTGGTFFGHDVEMVEAALEEAVKIEKASGKKGK